MFLLTNLLQIKQTEGKNSVLAKVPAIGKSQNREAAKLKRLQYA